MMSWRIVSTAASIWHRLLTQVPNCQAADASQPQHANHPGISLLQSICILGQSEQVQLDGDALCNAHSSGPPDKIICLYQQGSTQEIGHSPTRCTQYDTAWPVGTCQNEVADEYSRAIYAVKPGICHDLSLGHAKLHQDFHGAMPSIREKEIQYVHPVSCACILAEQTSQQIRPDRPLLAVCS